MITCGCIIHPGQTHEEHMDEFDKAQNAAMLPVDQLTPASPALYRAFCDAEIRRLKEKEHNMRLGKIRCKHKLNGFECDVCKWGEQ